MVLRISDKIGQPDQTDQNVNLSFSVNLINDTPVVVVDHPEQSGFVNELDDGGVPVNPQVVFPEGTVKLIDNDDPTIVSLTVKIRNPENGDLLFVPQSNPLILGMEISDYDVSTASITFSGSFKLDTYAPLSNEIFLFFFNLLIIFGIKWFTSLSPIHESKS